jgi:hypothetical protein
LARKKLKTIVAPDIAREPVFTKRDTLDLAAKPDKL